MVTKLVGAAMTRQQLDSTVQRYLVSFITVALNIILVVAILGYFGVETTSFAALVAGAGVAIALLKQEVSKVANISTTPPVDVEILKFNEFGPKLAVRPNCHTAHYWQVYFDTNRTIADTLGAAGFPVATRPLKIYPI